jgi:hypothetical protein
VVIIGCEKYKVKKNYTGEFIFTSINNEVYSYIYCPGDSVIIDTVVSEGTITWVEETNLLISFSTFNYNVLVDKDNLSLITTGYSTPRPGTGKWVDGHFFSKDEVEFTYNDIYSFQGKSWDVKRIVHGVRK